VPSSSKYPDTAVIQEEAADAFLSNWMVDELKHKDFI
jgi:hypothetical protein